MKLRGTKISPPKPKYVIIPRDEGEDIVFICQPVMNDDDFNKLVPEPKAPWVQKVGKDGYHDVNDRSFLKKTDDRHELRVAWMILKSLQGTPGLEWETVRMDEPDSWKNYRVELEESFTDSEIGMIINGVFDSSIPSQERRKEAIDRFFQSRRVEEDTNSSEKDGQQNIESGEPANAFV